MKALANRLCSLTFTIAMPWPRSHPCVIVYPKQLLLTVLRDQSDLVEDFRSRFVRKSQSLKASLELRSIRSARERVLQYLLMAARPSETSVNFDRPFKDIASELGLSPEVLYRTLAQLERDGIIIRNARTNYSVYAINMIQIIFLAW